MKVGDSVLIEKGRTQGIVAYTINTKEAQDWELDDDQTGIMVKAEPFGLVLWSADDSDPVIFVARQK